MDRPFVPDLFHYHRRKTRVVKVGKIGVGGENPVRIQSMTTTPTADVNATVAQAIRMVQAGCEMVRMTAPTLADARALGDIRRQLNAKGYAAIPLVADIHFNPECAMEAADHVEKIRVNPGNYADSKTFKIKEYSDQEYHAELVRIEERFTPLVLKCKSLGRAMRLGANHGSLSDRILNRYGDSPEGMVESALEFVRICRKHDYHDLILSMKSSNVKVMIAAYRLLVVRLQEEGMDYPFHLGVTEAGYGEDGRIKSVIGIGSLLSDGIGDTIRVSLTEDPEYEMPVAFQIAKPYQPMGVIASAPASSFDGKGARGNLPSQGQIATSRLPDQAAEAAPRDDGLNGLSHVDNFYHYARRTTRTIPIGPFMLGGENAVRVISDVSPWLGDQTDPQKVVKEILRFFEKQRSSDNDSVPEILEWPVPDEKALEFLKSVRRALGAEATRLAFWGRFTDFQTMTKGLPGVHAATYVGPRSIPDAERLDQFRVFIRSAREAGVTVVLESGPCHTGFLGPARNLVKGIECCEREGNQNLLLSFRLPTAQALIANTRLAAALLRQKGADYPFHLRLPGHPNFEEQRLQASLAFGALLCDGIGDSVQTGQGKEPAKDLELLYNVLQAAGVRITKAEFVTCPSCGRTLFDLQSTAERIKQKTGHLKGVKIAIMGCIVNGPGEMADADFGYVGGAPGRINLYVGRTCVEKGIPFDQADQRLIDLIKTHGKWVDPR
ncbi:MAG: (E)-4-hydroxy-3-methylbut-2-enyl-diphosphate synthase [Elusimicrobiota bacterium]|jgi:(E)-4-hydroxy-3-methylbut-2-enyl-diphosphate synthase